MVRQELDTSKNGTPMRICIVNEFFYPDDTGGTGTVLSDLADALRRDYGNVQIDVVTSNKLYRDRTARLPAAEDWNGIRIMRLDTPHPGGLPTARRLVANARFGAAALARLLRMGRYDLLLVGTAPPTVAMAADAYRAITKTPYLYVIYDLEPDRALALGVLSSRHPLTAVLRRWQKRWLHVAGRVVVLGRCMQDHLVGTYAMPEDRVKVIPIGADPEAIRPLSKQTRFRAEYGLDGFVICYSGNFGRYHDFDTILDAAKALQVSCPQAMFVLVGGGAQKDHVVRRVKDEALSNVLVLPFVPKDEYADLLASADASLVTLEPGMEGLCVPSKFYSILASGRPTIAMVAPTSEVALVIAEAECGVRIDQGDASRLVEAITDLAAAPPTAKRMGQNARTTLTGKYSTQQIAALYYDAACEVLGISAAATSSRPSMALSWAAGSSPERLAACEADRSESQPRLTVLAGEHPKGEKDRMHPYRKG